MKNFTQNLFLVALLLFGTTIFSQEPVEEDSTHETFHSKSFFKKFLRPKLCLTEVASS